MFTRFTPTDTIFLLVYVDDILITGSSKPLVQDFIHNLNKIFGLKDLGPLHYFLRIEVTWLPNNTFHLSQHKYIHDLLQRVHMLDSKPQPTPIVSSFRLVADASVAVVDPTLYR